MKRASQLPKIFLLLITISFINCILDKNNPIGNHEVISNGIIKKQGETGYMYGTHVLKDDNGKTLYALKSNIINLDVYIDRKVTVKGDLVDGYTVDGGPDYLNVKSIFCPPI